MSIIEDKSGYVYILSNKCFNYLKIGKSKHPDKRCIELSNTSIPFPFIIEITKRFDDCYKAESLLHKIFSKKRINPKREFFDITLKEIEIILSEIPSKNIDFIYFDDEKEEPEVINEIIEENNDESEENSNDEDENIVLITNNNYKDIKDYDFNFVKLMSCNKLAINQRQSLRQIIKNLYIEINNKENIFKYKAKSTTIWNDNKKNISPNYQYFDKYNITLTTLSSPNCINEIVSQCIGNKIELLLNLLLQDGTTMQIKLNTTAVF